MTDKFQCVKFFMILKLKYLCIAFMFCFICAGFLLKELKGEAQQRIDIPELQIIAEKQAFMLYEPISVRFIVKNIYKQPISIPFVAVGPVGCGTIRFSLVNLEDIHTLLSYNVPDDCHWNRVTLEPDEILEWNYDFSLYKKIDAGNFKMTAQYGDYYDKMKMENYSASIINSLVNKEIVFHITNPEGEDKQAMEFAGSQEKLLYLQSKNTSMMPSDYQEETTRDPFDPGGKYAKTRRKMDAFRKLFIEKFPNSIYTRNVLMALAYSSAREKNYSDAIKYFQEYSKRYPDSWYVPEALFQIAFCQKKTGMLIDAIATITKLQNMKIDTSLKASIKTFKEEIHGND
jgi:Tetratricopeptide repeat